MLQHAGRVKATLLRVVPIVVILFECPQSKDYSTWGVHKRDPNLLKLPCDSTGIMGPSTDDTILVPHMSCLTLRCPCFKALCAVALYFGRQFCHDVMSFHVTLISKQ